MRSTNGVTMDSEVANSGQDRRPEGAQFTDSAQYIPPLMIEIGGLAEVTKGNGNPGNVPDAPGGSAGITTN